MTKLPVLFTLPVLITLHACSGHMAPSEFRKHVEDDKNGFVRTVDAAPFRIRCLYMPAAYMAVMSFRSDDIPRPEFETREAEFARFDMYRLDITSDDRQELAALAEYFAFYMQDETKKIYGTDTLPCAVYQAEPFDAMAGRQRIEIGFEHRDAGKDEQVLLRRTPLSAQPVSIPFDRSGITIPQINLN